MRKLGQHFLYDPKIARKIAELAQINKSETVLEIGPGKGIITAELCARAAKVIVVEKDPKLAELLKGRFENLKLICADALKIKWPKFDKLVSSLPFQISSPVLERLCQLHKPALLVLQKEFAQRLCAKPCERDYSKLSLVAQAYFNIEILGHLKPGAFRPKPKVSATIVRLTPKKTRLNKRVLYVISKLFPYKRKTLRAALRCARLRVKVPRELEEKRIFCCTLKDFKLIAGALNEGYEKNT